MKLYLEGRVAEAAKSRSLLSAAWCVLILRWPKSRDIRSINQEISSNTASYTFILLQHNLHQQKILLLTEQISDGNVGIASGSWKVREWKMADDVMILRFYKFCNSWIESPEIWRKIIVPTVRSWGVIFRLFSLRVSFFSLAENCTYEA